LTLILAVRLRTKVWDQTRTVQLCWNFY
jgi:hypothetical protein